MKRISNVPGHVTHGSVLDDLGFSPAEALALKVKADIYRDLMAYIRSQSYTQQQLITELKMPQSDVSNLMNGRVGKFSVGKLIKLAGRLDLGAEVRLTPRSKPAKANGRVQIRPKALAS